MGNIVLLSWLNAPLIWGLFKLKLLSLKGNEGEGEQDEDSFFFKYLKAKRVMRRCQNMNSTSLSLLSIISTQYKRVCVLFYTSEKDFSF